MIGILIVTHGRLAEELKAAALTIQPGIEQIVAVALDWNQVGDDASARIAEGLEEADLGDGAVILTDMFGGTPTNIASTFLGQENVEVVTGVNLPMLIKLAQAQVDPSQDLAGVARMVRESGQSSIYRASDLLAPKNRP